MARLGLLRFLPPQPMLLLVLVLFVAADAAGKGDGGLRFRREDGTFKVLQVADMHYANGRSTGCEDVLPAQVPGCSDLNTTAFLYRLLRAEEPDLVVFTGDNIFGNDSSDSTKSMDAAIAPAIAMKLPWAAVLGNHDQEGTLSREGVMRHLVGINPWLWLDQGFIGSLVQANILESPGVKQEKGISSPSINSGFFNTMVKAGDVKAAFVGHDHLNDFCGKLTRIQLCYAGGFSYHAYGKAGWSRRARVVSVQLEKAVSGEWQGVKSINTWKRLDDQHLTTIDSEVLWNISSN